MNEDTRTALDAETPVNPYSLLDALNAASARTSTLWLIFLALMAYLLVTVAAVTHRHLLLDSGVMLPFLQVRIDLSRFFLFAPAILALLHLGLIAQFALLARKALEFDAALRLLESTDLRTHPLRLELDTFFFVQGIAGPERSRLVSGFLNGIGWLTLLAFPLLLLLYMQVAFLPFHDAAVTAVQRVIVVADIAVLVLVGVFVVRAETTFLGALLRFGVNNPGSLVFGAALLASAAFVSLFLATVPGAAVASDRASAVSSADGALFGIIPRNLDVAYGGPVSGTEAAFAGRAIDLRGRDLRFARLDGIDLRRADLTGANLDGASLVGADLRGIRLGCAVVGPPPQVDERHKALCPGARAADFSGARLAGASLAGADLRGTKFDGASLEGAALGRALLAGASFVRARLQRADLSGASLQGASFVLAKMQGAVLADARLERADLSGASLQGANLSLAHLVGAVLREADLEGADLRAAKLYGANLRGTRLQAADLAGAMVWRAAPPAGDAVALADLANIVMKAPGEDDMAALKTVAAGAGAPPVGEGPTDVADLLAQPASDWAGSADGQAWMGLLRASEAAMADAYPIRLAEHLARTGCRSRFADGAVASGLARRASAQGFKGDPAAVYTRFKAADCPASRTIPPGLLLDLAAVVEAQQPTPVRALVPAPPEAANAEPAPR